MSWHTVDIRAPFSATLCVLPGNYGVVFSLKSRGDSALVLQRTRPGGIEVFTEPVARESAPAMVRGSINADNELAFHAFVVSIFSMDPRLWAASFCTSASRPRMS